MSMGYNWIEAVIFVIGIIVANVPEVRRLPVTSVIILFFYRVF